MRSCCQVIPASRRSSQKSVEIVEGSLTDRAAVSEAVSGSVASPIWPRSCCGVRVLTRSCSTRTLPGPFIFWDAIVEQGIELERFFLASSDEVYSVSEGPATLPIDESHPLNPYSFYGLTKETNERFAFYYHRAHGVPATVARFALIARSDEILRPDGWSGRFMFVAPMRDLFIALGRPDGAAAIDAACPGDPSSTLLLALDEDGVPYEFHMCDVKDVVAGIDLMLIKPSAVGQVFNLSGPSPFSYRSAVEALHQATGMPFVEVRIPGPPIRIAHDISKARSMLGYTPERDIVRIIADAVAGK